MLFFFQSYLQFPSAKVKVFFLATRKCVIWLTAEQDSLVQLLSTKCNLFFCRDKFKGYFLPLVYTSPKDRCRLMVASSLGDVVVRHEEGSRAYGDRKEENRGWQWRLGRRKMELAIARISPDKLCSKKRIQSYLRYEEIAWSSNRSFYFIKRIRKTLTWVEKPEHFWGSLETRYELLKKLLNNTMKLNGLKKNDDINTLWFSVCSLPLFFSYSARMRLLCRIIKHVRKIEHRKSKNESSGSFWQPETANWFETLLRPSDLPYKTTFLRIFSDSL